MRRYPSVSLGGAPLLGTSTGGQKEGTEVRRGAPRNLTGIGLPTLGFGRASMQSAQESMPRSRASLPHMVQAGRKISASGTIGARSLGPSAQRSRVWEKSAASLCRWQRVSSKSERWQTNSG